MNMDNSRRIPERNLLIALFLMTIGHTVSDHPSIRLLVFSVYVPMLYFWIGYEMERESWRVSFRKVLLPGILTALASSLMSFFASEGQTPINFLRQMKALAFQLFWANGAPVAGHSTVGIPWIFASLFWCSLWYRGLTFPSDIRGNKDGRNTYRRNIIASAARIFAAAIMAFAGVSLARRSIFLPLALDVSLTGMIFYTAGGEFSVFQKYYGSTVSDLSDSPTASDASKQPQNSRTVRPAITAIAEAAVMLAAAAFWAVMVHHAQLGIEFATRSYTNPVVIVEAFAGITVIYLLTIYSGRFYVVMKKHSLHSRTANEQDDGLKSYADSHIASYYPQVSGRKENFSLSWLQGYSWVILAISVHALDWMTGIWWNRGTWISASILRFLLLLLITDFLLYIWQRWKETASSGETDFLLDRISGFLNDHLKLTKGIFYTAFAVCYFVRYFDSTMFVTWNINWKHFYEVFDAAVFLVAAEAIHVLHETGDKRAFFGKLLILLIGFLQWQSGGNYDLFILTALVVSMTGKSAKTVMKLSLIIGIPILFAALFASQNGYIYYFVYPDGGHALGMVYKTDLMAHWFYALLVWAVLREGRFTWFEFPLLFGYTQYLYHLTKAFNGYICMMLFLAILFVLYAKRMIRPVSDSSFEDNRQHKKVIRQKADHLLTYSYMIGTAVSYLASLLIPDSASFLQFGKLSSIRERIRLSKLAFRKFPLTLLGQPVAEQGAGGVVPENSSYFFLDNSYVRILIIYGILMLVLVLVICTSLLRRALSERKTVLFLALIIVSLHSLIEHHLTEFWYNIFLVLLFAEIDPECKKRSVDNDQ